MRFKTLKRLPENENFVGFMQSRAMDSSVFNGNYNGNKIYKFFYCRYIVRKRYLHTRGSCVISWRAAFNRIRFYARA
jgi:hypothetical protein